MKISVCMTCYNQERYIGQAIESVIYQTTPWPFELVIGEDHSQDKSLDICRHFAALHPRLIKVNARPANLGVTRNMATTWAECQGDYIAILDGDDYWTSPLKLMVQGRYLDSHPEHSMCFTTTTLNSEVPNRHDRWPYRDNCKPVLKTSDLLRHNLIANCSVMYRRAFRQFPEWVLPLPHCDLVLHCLHSLNGPVGYIPQPMSTYRLHHSSAFEGLSYPERMKRACELYAALANHLPQPYSAEAMQVLLLMRLGLGLKRWKDSMATIAHLPLKYQLTWPLLPLEQLYHLWRTRK